MNARARVYELLPAVYRLRDDARNHPLRELLTVISRELEALEENIEQLYDDQFIETCADWVAPYIGELVGYRSLHGVAPAIATPRADVANTIAFRRRKGTALMLEELASSVTSWPARTVEFFEQLATTQYLNHVRPHALATADLRSQKAMLTVGGAFNTAAHTVEVRRAPVGGRYNIPNIGIFLWRLKSHGLHALPLAPHPGDATGRRFRVNPLGADLPLFRKPATEPDMDHLALPRNVPDPLRIRTFARQVREATAGELEVRRSDDYGAGASFVITRQGVDEPLRIAGVAPEEDPDALSVVRIADLRDIFDSGGNVVAWAHEDDIGETQIAVDPERGRVLLGTARVADHASDPFKATFHYGFSRDIGGGDYSRLPADAHDITAPRLESSAAAALQPLLDSLGNSGGRLLITDSLTCAQSLSFKCPAGTQDRVTTVIGARDGQRPLVAAAGSLPVEIGANGTLVLDGLVISGGTLHLAAAADNARRTLVLRDCTLVPGQRLNPDGSAVHAGEPSLRVDHPFAEVRLERCITGPLHTLADAGVVVTLTDCIVDAGNDATPAFRGIAADTPGAESTLRECTVFGAWHTELLRLASNCLFTGDVRVTRRQSGCMRFSYAPPTSVTPRRFHCQPDAAHPGVKPHFTSVRYGDPGYAQLRAFTDRAIREGAADGGEMGVMHALHQPQRETNLRIRLDEYLRFGLSAGFIYVT